jgi:hypothetical protein
MPVAEQLDGDAIAAIVGTTGPAFSEQTRHRAVRIGRNLKVFA